MEPTPPPTTAPSSAHDHAALGSALSAGQSYAIHGLASAAATPFIVALLPNLTTSALLLCEHEGDALRLATHLRRTFPQRRVLRYPTHQHYAYETKQLDPQAVTDRLAVHAALAEHPDCIVVATSRAALQPTISQATWRTCRQTIHPGDQLDPVTFAERCRSYGYRSAQSLAQPGDVRRVGGVVDIYPDQGSPVRVEFFDTTIESIRTYNPIEHRCIAPLAALTISLRVEADLQRLPALIEQLRSGVLGELETTTHAEWAGFLDPLSHGVPFVGDTIIQPLLLDTPPATLLDTLPPQTIVCITNPDGCITQAANQARYEPATRLRLMQHRRLPQWYPTVSAPADRLLRTPQLLLLSDAPPEHLRLLDTRCPLQTLVYTNPASRADADATRDLPYEPGQYVTHLDHGIAVFEGIVLQNLAGKNRPYLKLRFAGTDKLYVPESQFDRVTPYGTSTPPPTLTVLGTRDW
ncbi:MAG: hypothetical protein RLZZ297_124 [Chloroflexota bacterium]|jgi:transcription-repair coupling factor (superfamily II helicase)